jgi:hypothetical protein
MHRPKSTLAAALCMLAALAGTMTYTGYLVVGVLADYLGTGRGAAGLLLGVLFARFPWASGGQFRIVGLLPKPLRRPLIVALLGFCSLVFLSRGDLVSAGFTGFGAAFVLLFPWLRTTIFDRMRSSVVNFAGRRSPQRTDHAGRIDDTVIEGEFREMKE